MRTHREAACLQGVARRWSRYGGGDGRCKSCHWCRKRDRSRGRLEDYDSNRAGATTALGAATTAACAAEIISGAAVMVPGVVYAGEARVAKDIAQLCPLKVKQRHEEQMDCLRHEQQKPQKKKNDTKTTSETNTVA